MLDIALGLLTVFCAVAVFASFATETYVRLFAVRARLMRKRLDTHFDDAKWIDGVLASYRRVHGLGANPTRIDPDGIAAIMHKNLPTAPERVRAKVRAWQHEQGSGDALVTQLSGLRAQLKEDNLWRTKLRLFLAGLLLAIAINADAVRLVGGLQHNPVLVHAAAASMTDDDLASAAKATGHLWPLMGWGSDTTGPDTSDQGWPLRILGWLITAAAASLGAPFWFDLLRMVRSRSKGPGEEAKEETPTPERPPADGTAPSQPVLPQPPFAGFVPQGPPCLSSASDLADLARIAYLDDDEAAAELAAAGLQVVSFLNDTANDTQGFIAYGRGAIFVTFRGTEPSGIDAGTDGRFLRQAAAWSATTCEVHTGFNESLPEALWQDILTALESPALRDLPVWFSGHSLGGALATLAAARLHHAKQRIAGVVTIGQPRVGCELFATWYDTTLGLRGRHWRIVRGADPVTMLPPAAIGYRHVGTQLYLNQDGGFREAAPNWLQYLDTAIDVIQGKASEAIDDHSCDDYVKALSALRPS
ncbi:MAG: lipase family protein [Planctomycetota bacterium]|jgi:triacylglycerol lipase|nr:lipase family protein [Planctomycetota bacterium]